MSASVAAQGRCQVLVDRLPGSRVRDVVAVVGAIGMLVVSAQVSIPLPFTPVPITGQTFAVLLIGSAYGLARGLTAMLGYLAVGMAGLPVFSKNPKTGLARTGMEMLSSPSAGYIVGMVVAVALLGWLSQRTWDRRLRTCIPQMLAASVLVYACGLPWLAYAAHLDLVRTLQLGLLPFIPGDVIKLLAAGALLPAAWRLVR